MKTLLLFRHAKSSHDTAGTDHARPLNERGRHDAPIMAQRLVEAGALPSRILCSTARRATQTAELFLFAARFEGQVAYIDRLYHAAPDDILAVIAESGGDADHLMVVGHNPGLEELVARLTGAPGHMPTAAIACIELPITNWQDVRRSTGGTLKEFWKPKDAQKRYGGRKEE